MRLAIEIRELYGNEELHLICILKGSRGFFSELVDCLDKLYMYTDGHARPPYMEHYVRIKSHVDANNKYHVNIMSGDLSVLKNKNVLIVEDIIDTGLTLSKILELLRGRHPRSLKVCTLLNKPSRRQTPVTVDYNGFDIEDVFVAGYGIDFAQKYRNLPQLVVVKKL
jgi:hypoxanthine phosphoribosyltransferase